MPDLTELLSLDQPAHLAAALAALVVLSVAMGVGIGYLMDRKERQR